jgi:hypothetical protein
MDKLSNSMDFKKFVLNELQNDKDIPQIMEILKDEATNILINYVTGTRVNTKTNRIIRQ